MKHRVALIVIALLIPTAAIAKGQCQDDRQKFCEGLEEYWPCLVEHKDQLSESCKAKLEAEAERPAPTEEPTPTEEPAPTEDR